MHRQTDSGRRAHATVACSLLAAFSLACGSDDQPDAEATPKTAATSPGSIRTQPLESDPCSWVQPAEVERLVGKLEGPPTTRTQDGGTACVYILPETGARPAYTIPGMTPPQEMLTVRVDFEDALGYEAAYGMGEELVVRDPGYQALVAAGEPLEEPAKPEGWDYFGEGALGAVFRLGHMAIVIGVNTPRHFDGKEQTAIAVKLAALVRDRVPDLPVAAEGSDGRIGSGAPDPCSLISREEAEAVLGELMLPPYRSAKAKPFVQEQGRSCTYYRGRHRALVITPYWRGGRDRFSLASGLTDAFTSKTGLGEHSADTLEGPWDQAKAGLEGTLDFLTGDRMLELSHGMSGVPPAEALKLAKLAVERLGKMNL